MRDMIARGWKSHGQRQRDSQRDAAHQATAQAACWREQLLEMPQRFAALDVVPGIGSASVLLVVAVRVTGACGQKQRVRPLKITGDQKCHVSMQRCCVEPT